ncbi:AAA family ATPase [Mycoplasma sp. E35C]|uniref:AAA family ATPase n=1 Tax=Mycoplasma sp. E35C TaxID=2801918 RepID=UPI001CA39439|nr:AAA family ATPase [Mycoplasma sp. E35C]QZX49084.1 ParA family protein [Mycoplasma sp. E35C]
MQSTKFISVTSTIKNSGKTSTALGLVISLVTDGYKVLYLSVDNKFNFLPREKEDHNLVRDYILKKVTLKRATRHFYSFYPFDILDIDVENVKWLLQLTEKQQATLISKTLKEIAYERYHYVVIDINYKDKPLHNAIINMSDHVFYTINVKRYEEKVTQHEINSFFSLINKKDHVKLLITQFNKFMVDHHKFIENLKYIYDGFLLDHQIETSRAMRNRIDHAYNFTRVDKLCKPIKNFLLKS